MIWLIGFVFGILFVGFITSRFGKFIKECDDAQEAAWRDYIEENE